MERKESKGTQLLLQTSHCIPGSDGISHYNGNSQFSDPRMHKSFHCSSRVVSYRMGSHSHFLIGVPDTLNTPTWIVGDQDRLWTYGCPFLQAVEV